MRRFASLFGRRGVLAAAVVAAFVLAVVVAQQALSTLIIGGVEALRGMGGGSLHVFPQVVAQGAWNALPFAIGVFLSLWVIAPVAAELRLAHVITRSVLAAAVGAVLVFIVRFVSGMVGWAAVSGDLFGDPRSFLRSAGSLLVYSVEPGISAAITLLPLTVLATVLLWIWLDRHPAKHPVFGIIDEV